jgi:hypothetical protein
MKGWFVCLMLVLLVLTSSLVGAQDSSATAQTLVDKAHWEIQLQGADLTLIYQAISLLGYLGDDSTVTLLDSEKDRVLGLAKSEFGDDGELSYSKAFDSSIRRIRGEDDPLDASQKVILLDIQTGQLEIAKAGDLTLYGVKIPDHDRLPYPERLVGIYEDPFVQTLPSWKLTGSGITNVGYLRCIGENMGADIFNSPEVVTIRSSLGDTSITSTYQNHCLKGKTNDLNTHNINFVKSSEGDYIYYYFCELHDPREVNSNQFPFLLPKAAIYACDCVRGRCLDDSGAILNERRSTFRDNLGISSKKTIYVSPPPLDQEIYQTVDARVFPASFVRPASSTIGGAIIGAQVASTNMGVEDISQYPISDVWAVQEDITWEPIPPLAPGEVTIEHLHASDVSQVPELPSLFYVDDIDLDGIKITFSDDEEGTYPLEPIVADSSDDIWATRTDGSAQLANNIVPREFVQGSPGGFTPEYRKYGTKMVLHSTQIILNSHPYIVLPKGLVYFYANKNIYSAEDTTKFLPSDLEEQIVNLVGNDVSGSAVSENIKGYAETAKEGNERKTRDLYRKNPKAFKNMLKKGGKAFAGKFVRDAGGFDFREDRPDDPPKEKPKASEVTLRTDPRVFGPPVSDPKVGGNGIVGNNRPEDLNPDNNVLSDQDPWQCGIDFDLGPDDQVIGSVGFSLVDDQWNTLFIGTADCNGFFCTGIIPREKVARGKRVACVYKGEEEDKVSNWVDVAKILFVVTEAQKEGYVMPIGGYIRNIDSQFNFFLSRTLLGSGEFKIITRNREDCRAEFPLIGFTPFSTSTCLESLGESWNENTDVLIHFQEMDLPSQTLIRDRTIFITRDNNNLHLANRMGNLFGLADETNQIQYKRQTDEYGIVNNDYPPCCSDYYDFGNPYLSTMDDFGVVQVNCEQSAGACKSSCGDAELSVHGSFYNDCTDTNICCVNKFEYGNNCYPRHIAPSELCAGMPLDIKGKRSVAPLAPQGQVYLDAEYRSIMGDFESLLDEDFHADKLVYPQVPGLVWPLRPGSVQAAWQGDDRLHPDDLKAIENSGLSQPVKEIMKDIIINLYDNEELRNIIADAEIYHGEIYENEEVEDILGDGRFQIISSHLKEMRRVKDLFMRYELKQPLKVEITYKDGTKNSFDTFNYNTRSADFKLQEYKDRGAPPWEIWAYEVAVREAKTVNIYLEKLNEETLAEIKGDNDKIEDVDTNTLPGYAEKKYNEYVFESSRKKFIPFYEVVVNEDTRNIFLNTDGERHMFEQLDAAAGRAGHGYMVNLWGDGADVLGFLSRLKATLTGDIDFEPGMLGLSALGAVAPIFSTALLTRIAHSTKLMDTMASQDITWRAIMNSFEKIGVYVRKEGQLIAEDPTLLANIMESAAGTGSKSFDRGAIQGLKVKKPIQSAGRDISRGGADIIEMARHSNGAMEVRTFSPFTRGEGGAVSTIEIAAADYKAAEKLRTQGVASYLNDVARTVDQANAGRAVKETYGYAVGAIRADGLFEYATGGANRFYVVGADGTATKLSSSSVELGRGVPPVVSTHSLKPGDRVIAITDGVMQGLGYLSGRSLTEVEDIIEFILRLNSDESLDNIYDAIATRVKVETKLLLEGVNTPGAAARLAGLVDDSSVAMVKFIDGIGEDTRLINLKNTPYGKVTLVSTPALRKAELEAAALYERTGIDIKLTGGNLRNGVLGKNPFDSKDIDVHVTVPDEYLDAAAGGFHPDLGGRSLFGYLQDVVFDSVDGVHPDILIINGVPNPRAEGLVKGADFTISRVEYSLATGITKAPESYWGDIARRQIVLTDLEDIPNLHALSPKKILKALKNLKPTTNFYGKALRMARFAGQYDVAEDALSLAVIKADIGGVFKKLKLDSAGIGGTTLDGELYKVFSNAADAGKSVKVLKGVGIYGKLKRLGYDMDAYVKYASTKDPYDLWDAVKGIKHDGKNPYLQFAENGGGPTSLMSSTVRNILEATKPWLLSNADNLLRTNNLVSEQRIVDAFGKALKPSDGTPIESGAQKITTLYEAPDGSKYVIQELIVASDKTLADELAVRKLASEMGFSEFGVPSAVGYKGADGKYYLISENVDATRSVDMWNSMSDSQRTELAAFAYTFGITDLNKGNFLFHDQGVWWLDFIGSFRKIADVGSDSLDPARETYIGRALKELQGPYVDKISLNDPSIYSRSIEKWRSIVEGHDFEAAFRKILENSGYPSDKIDEALENVKANARNLEKNIGDRLFITNGALLTESNFADVFDQGILQISSLEDLVSDGNVVKKAGVARKAYIADDEVVKVQKTFDEVIDDDASGIRTLEEYDEIVAAQHSNEVEILGGLEGKLEGNIPRLIDHGESSNGMPWQMQTKVDGDDLVPFIESATSAQKQEIKNALELARKKLEDEGILYSDWNTGNVVIITKDDGSLDVGLIDFGLAKNRDSIIDPDELTDAVFWDDEWFNELVAFVAP